MAITDDFNRASLGSNWAAAEGTVWTVVGSTVVRPVDAYAWTSIVRTESTFPDDQYAQCEATIETTGDLGGTGPMVRSNGSNTSYFAVIGTTTTIRLYKRVVGTSTEIGSYASGTYNAGTFYTLKLTVTGTTVTVDVDTVQRISVTDAAIASGKPGIAALTGDATHPDADDFECTDATASSTLWAQSVM